MNVYYSGWGFVIKRKSVVNGELIEYIDDELPNWYRVQIHEAQVYDVTKIRDYFRLPSEEPTELKNMGSVSISYLFNDDVFIIICNKHGFPRPINLLGDGTVSKKKENAIKLILEDTATILEPTNAPPVDSENLQSLSVGDLEQNNSFLNNENNESNDDKLKVEERLDKILIVIIELGFNPQLIPRGGKKKILEQCCLNYAELFPSENTFEKAWEKRGILFGMKDGKKHARRIKQ